MKKTPMRRAVAKIFEIQDLTDAEDRLITDAALADPDAQPMTDEQLANMRPIQQYPELLKKLAK